MSPPRPFFSRLAVLTLLVPLAACDLWSIPAVNSEGTEKVTSLMRVADATRAGGDLASSIQLYRRAHETAPERAEPLIAMATTLAALDEPGEAAEAWRAVLARQPDNSDAMRGLGIAMLAQDQPQLALAQFDGALRLTPKDPRIHNAMGVALDMLEDHGAAQRRYRSGLVLDPNNGSLRNNLGLSLAVSGLYEEAVTILSKLASEPAAPPRARQNLALVLGLSGHPVPAAEIGRVDLDAKTVQRNLKAYELLRAMRTEMTTRDDRAVTPTVEPGK